MRRPLDAVWPQPPHHRQAQVPGWDRCQPASSLLCHNCHMMKKQLPGGAPDGKGQSPSLEARDALSRHLGWPRDAESLSVELLSLIQHTLQGDRAAMGPTVWPGASLPAACSVPGPRGCVGQKQRQPKATVSTRVVCQLPWDVL